MAYAAAHNGGLSQLNLGSVPYNGDYPFINCALASAGWTCLNPDSTPDPDILDVNGYPTQNTNGQGHKKFLCIPRQADKPGEWVLEWDGNGTMMNPFTTQNPTSGSLTSTTGSGRATGIPWTNKIEIGYATTAVAPNHIRNIRFYHSSEAARFAAGEMFGADFLAVIRELRPGVLRFMDWFNNNTNNIPNWAARKSVNFHSYFASEYRGAAWGANKWYFGITSGTPNNYTINTNRGRAPQHGDVIQLYFHADATPSGLCSLNVDGFGAKNILSEYGLALTTGGNSYPIRFAFSDPNQRAYATLVYDGVINMWVKQGGDAAANATGLNSSCPFEVAFRLAAELGVHPMFTTPVQTIDPLTDYLIQSATYCRDNAPSWMVPRFESPNEVFNSFGGFYNHGWVQNHSDAYGWNDWQPTVGKFLSVAGQALNTVYGNDRTKFKLLAGVQTVAAGSGHSSLLTSAEYVAQAAPAQSPYIKAPASNYVHGVLGANYFGPSSQDQTGEQTLATAFAGGDSTAPATYLQQCYNSSPGFPIPRNVSDFTAWKNFALSHGVHEVHFYEGGYSPDYDGRVDVDNLKEASKYVAALKQVIQDDYNGILALTDATFTVFNPSHYYLSANKYLDGAHASVMPGLGTRISVWSLLEDIYQQPRPPEFQGIAAFNAAGGSPTPPPPPPPPANTRLLRFRISRK